MKGTNPRKVASPLAGLEANTGQLRRAVAFGPGLVFFMTAIGPRDLVSNSVAGAAYGYGVIWTVALILILRFAALEASGRYILATGENLLAGYQRMGKWVSWLLLISAMLKRHFGAVFEIVLFGSTAHLLVPLATRHSTAIWSLVFWSLGLGLMYWGRYRMVERLSKPFILLLGGSVLATALLSRPDLGAIVRGVLVPVVPEEQASYSFALVFMALLGAGAPSLSNLNYAAFVHEKGWRDPSFLRSQRLELLLSVVGMFAVGVLIQVAAAETLRPHGKELSRIEDLVPLFSEHLGTAGHIVLGVGLLAAAFTTFIGACTGYSLVVSDVFHRAIRPSEEISHEMIEAGAGELPAFRGWILWFAITPLYVLFTDWRPVMLVLLASAMSVIVMPVTIVILLRLTSDRRIMGEHVNRWWTNVVLALATVGSVFLICRAAVDLWQGL